MTCTHSFRTVSPQKILRGVYIEQMKMHRNPLHDEDFLRLKSRDIFRIAGLELSHAALYSILTKLTESGLFSVHQNPNHAQGFVYSITAQGMRCCRCKAYQDGFKPLPPGFSCGPIGALVTPIDTPIDTARA